MLRETKESWLALIMVLTTSTTLICCTLPIILIVLGLGSTLTAITLHFSGWIAFSENKFWLFLLSGLLILATHWTIYRQGRVCPADPLLAKRCDRLMKWNRLLLKIAVCFWLIGFVSAYLLAPLYSWFSF